MGVGEKGSTCSKGIDVRRFDLGVAAEAAGPIVEIIDADEQNVRRLGIQRTNRAEHHQRKKPADGVEVKWRHRGGGLSGVERVE